MSRKAFLRAGLIAIGLLLLPAGIQSYAAPVKVVIGGSPSVTVTPKPKATPKPTKKPKAKPKKSSKPKKTPKPTPTPKVNDGKITAVDSAYICEVLRGINDARTLEGNLPVSQDSRLDALAQAHAPKMAELGRWVHSDYHMIESVGAGSEDGMQPYGVGSFSAYHAPQIAFDATVTRVGIGAVKKDGRIYVVIVAE